MSKYIKLTYEDMKDQDIKKFDHIEEQSIWKPIDYYLTQPYAFQGFIKIDNNISLGKIADGSFYFDGDRMKLFPQTSNLIKFCTVDNFINDYEKLKEIVNDLVKAKEK